MRIKLMLASFFAVITITGNSIALAAAPEAAPMMADLVMPAAPEPAASLRQQLDYAVEQFGLVLNGEITERLAICHDQLTILKNGARAYNDSGRYDQQTVNIARTMCSFFDALQANITTCIEQINSLPLAAGASRYARAKQQKNRTAVQQQLGEIQNQLKTFFNILAGKQYSLAATTKDEHAIAQTIWHQQNIQSLTDVATRAMANCTLARLAAVNAKEAAIEGCNAITQSAKNCYLTHLFAQNKGINLLHELAGQLRNYGAGNYNWAMPYLVTAASILPSTHHSNEHDLEKVQSLLKYVSKSHLHRPWLIRFGLRNTPSSLLKAGEALVRTANTNLSNYRTWGSWLKWGIAKRVSTVSCACMRMIMGRSTYNNFARTTLQNKYLPSREFERLQSWYRENKDAKQQINWLINTAYYNQQKIRAGAAALKEKLTAWTNKNSAEPETALQNTMHDQLRTQLTAWGHQWHQDPA